MTDTFAFGQTLPYRADSWPLPYRMCAYQACVSNRTIYSFILHGTLSVMFSTVPPEKCGWSLGKINVNQVEAA